MDDKNQCNTNLQSMYMYSDFYSKQDIYNAIEVMFVPAVSQHGMANVALAGILPPFFQILGDPWISSILLSYGDYMLAQSLNRIVLQLFVRTDRVLM